MKKLVAFLLCVFLMLGSASAEIFYTNQVPEDWHQRELLKITAIDVDRSDALLMECGGEFMLVDGGSGQFRNRLYRAVDEAGAKKFKYLFSTHSDNDHVHGLIYLMRSGNYEVEMFTTPNKETYQDKAGYHKKAVNATKKMNIPYHIVEDGEELTLGTANLRVMRCMESWGQNARSAVLMAQLGERTILLTGDIDARTMEHYTEKYGAEKIKADIMKAPHHGLATIVEPFRSMVDAEMIYVPNLKKNTNKFNNYMKKNAPDTTLMYSGDGSIHMETDGTDWYIWQDADTTKNN